MKTIEVCVIAVVLTAGHAYAQGSLTPPGAPAATMKTLEQVEPRTPISSLPYTIYSSGSYYLTGNLSSAGHGIEINVDYVTIDLKGFTINGNTGSENFGIYLKGTLFNPLENIQIKNGTIRRFDRGIHGNYVLSSAFDRLFINDNKDYGSIISSPGIDSRNRFRDCVIDGNFGVGLWLSGSSGNRVENCSMSNNGESGAVISSPTQVYGTSGNHFVDCTISGNNGHGVYLNGEFAPCNRNTISGCTITGNLSNGIEVSGYGGGDASFNKILDCTISENGAGVLINANSGGECRGNRIVDCVVSDNGSHGIRGTDDSGTMIEGCSLQLNLGDGIYAGSSATIIGCSAYGNVDHGIRAGSRSLIQDSSATRNTGVSSASFGIYAGDYSAVIDCVSSHNDHTNSPATYLQGVGIRVTSGGTLRGCTASRNSGDGIFVSANNLIANNTCDNNGAGGDGAGIHATSTANRIDENQVTRNDRGIDVDSAGSIIIRNTASGNTVNYDIAGSNKDAQILTPGSGFTSTDPWANFSY